MIARRYSSQIREIEAKLRDKELVVEVGELESLRDDLMSLFREKILNIESRLDQANERLQPMREEMRAEPPRASSTARPAPAPTRPPRPRQRYRLPTTSRGWSRGGCRPGRKRATERRG